ncbi:LPS export ABC transporter periplasmic protein LptC [candidate division LCP-89 bacterium B3_LCP]|uniref:LPS export ABC transporter periplasmic protein LptC n=1 Tax=candidate division LCP-89 bacterium B3_LCP TaxID=2012998 RepID=A0A532V3N5_UNCL8|nr:MAG: LPS export ABC transporter periplasmic protein LptC [candidate division LCP-89 bacterium B3_LCP]
MRLVFIFSFCILLTGCSSRDSSPDISVSGKKKYPDQEIWDGKIEVTSDGRRQSVVQAGHILSFERDKITIFRKDVKVDFYDKSGELQSVLTSDSARIEEKRDLFVALGNVVVVSENGDVLKTERLYWDRKLQEVSSDTLVVLTTELDSLQGYDFVSNEDLTSWTLRNPTGQTFRQRRE